MFQDTIGHLKSTNFKDVLIIVDEQNKSPLLNICKLYLQLKVNNAEVARRFVELYRLWVKNKLSHHPAKPHGIQAYSD